MKLRSISTEIIMLFIMVALLINVTFIVMVNLYQTSSMYTNEYDQEIQEIASNFRSNHTKPIVEMIAIGDVDCS